MSQPPDGFLKGIREILNQTASTNLPVEPTPEEDRCSCRGQNCHCDFCAPERHAMCSADCHTYDCTSPWACCNDDCECS